MGRYDSAKNIKKNLHTKTMSVEFQLAIPHLHDGMIHSGQRKWQKDKALQKLFFRENKKVIIQLTF